MASDLPPVPCPDSRRADEPPAQDGVVVRVLKKIFFYQTNLTFKRPVGAAADVKELEYISALHQTDMTRVRKDASIKDVDIASFLMSRYGILVTPEEVRKTIMYGLGGGDTEDESLDMIEVVAILLIPTLLKAAQAGLGLSPFDDINIVQKDLKHAWQIAREKKKNRDATAVMPDDDMIEVVHRMILRDSTGSDAPRALSRDLLREILTAYGEGELAQDGGVLDEMLAIAGGAGAPFDVEGFTRALTADVDRYDPRKEIEESTFYYDVFGTDGDDIRANVAVVIEATDRDVEGGAGTSVESEAGISVRRVAVEDPTRECDMKKVYTNPSIDYSAGTYKSKYAVAFLWAFLMVLLLWIYTDKNDFFDFIPNILCGAEEDENGEVIYDENGDVKNPEFSTTTCETGNKIISSITYFICWGVLGMMLIGVGSFGNDTVGRVSFRFRGNKRTKKTKVMARIGLVMTTILITLFLVLQFSLRTGGLGHDDASLNYAATDSLSFFLCALGFLTLLTYMKNYLVLVLPPATFDAYEWLHDHMTPDSVSSEARVKRAAAFKIDHMADNAIELVRPGPGDRSLIKSWFGAAVLRFETEGDSERRFEDCGGVLWTWGRILSGELFTREGVWIHARLVSTNLCHFLVAIYILFYGYAMARSEGLNFIESMVVKMICMVGTFGQFDAVSDATDYLDILTKLHTNTSAIQDTCSQINFDFSVLNEMCPENGTLNSTDVGLMFKCYNAKYNIYEEEEVQTAIKFGAIVACLMTLVIAVNFIPSYTTSVLKLRSGVIPTFNDSYRNFAQIRQKPTQVSILNGMMFWGSVLSAFCFFKIFSALYFVLVWTKTEDYVWNKLIPNIIGLVIVILIKMIITNCVIDKKIYSGLFRSKPKTANVVSLFWETSSFVLSILFVISRAVKLGLLSIFYVGRVDTPLLAPNVALGPIKDNGPLTFRKEIIISDAHRHPYMELLGLMYLMKLKHGKAFGTNAGSTWRLIFVSALMPWLSKYRIYKKPAETISM